MLARACDKYWDALVMLSTARSSRVKVKAAAPWAMRGWSTSDGDWRASDALLTCTGAERQAFSAITTSRWNTLLHCWQIGRAHV